MTLSFNSRQSSPRAHDHLSRSRRYTDAVAKDKYDTLEEILAAKMADKELRSVLKTMFDGCGTITEALRKETAEASALAESLTEEEAQAVRGLSCSCGSCHNTIRTKHNSVLILSSLNIYQMSFIA